jgi:outer membrane protein assembly factor BamB
MDGKLSLRPFRGTLVLCLLLTIGSSSVGGERPAVTSSVHVGTTIHVGSTMSVSSSDWPAWRGLNRDGSADDAGDVPLEWSETEGVAWQTAIPGRGHGSPIVIGDQVIITSADVELQQQAVHAMDRRTGAVQWTTVVHSGGFAKKMNEKATLASTTPACDGERIFVNFLNDGAVFTTALNREGEKLWQTKISDYVIHQGYGSSPTLYKNLVIVAADNKSGGAIAALDVATGRTVWKHTRPSKPNYPSPVIVNAAGKDQLILTGCDLVQSFDPVTGKTLWEVEGATTECVTSTVSDGTVVFSSGGYPRNHISAYAADGSGKLVWEDTTRVYVPSMLLRDGLLFGVADAGIAFCRDSSTGKERWQGRLSGTFTSSPVLVNDHIYATNEAGMTSVFAADGDEFRLLSRNQLGDEVFATPAISRGCLFQRIARYDGEHRQEFVVCIGDPK